MKKLPNWALKEIRLSELKDFLGKQKEKGNNKISEEFRKYLLALLNGGLDEKLIGINFGSLKQDMEWSEYKSLFDYVFDKAQHSNFYVENILPKLIMNLDFSKEDLNKLFKKAVEIAKNNLLWAQYIIPELIKTKKKEKDNLEEAFKVAVKFSEHEQWLKYVVPALISSGEINERLLNEEVNLLFERGADGAKYSLYKLSYLIPLVKTGKVDSKLVKKKTSEIINHIQEEISKWLPLSYLHDDKYSISFSLYQLIGLLPEKEQVEFLKQEWIEEILGKEYYSLLVNNLNEIQ